MRTSAEINDIAAALARFQVRVATVTRDAKNPHFKSSFATLAAVRDACTALAAEGVAVIQSTTLDDRGLVLVTTLAHSSGQWVASEYPVRPVKDDPQGLGSALTYARRYSLMGMAGLAPDDDDGESACRPAPRQEQRTRVDGVEHPALARQPENPRAWWDRWRTACAGLPFADALAILRGAGIDTDSEPAVRDRWPSAEEAARKAARCSQPSRSREGQGYELARKPDGAWRCNCEAGAFGRVCVHAKAAEVAFWRRMMPSKAWQTIAAVCGDVPADDRLDEALALVTSWREMILEGDA